jgi:hypothetical protein
MKIKDLLQDLCSQLERDLNQRDDGGTYKVTLSSHLLTYDNSNNRWPLFVSEIKVNEVVVIKQEYRLRENEGFDIVEDMVSSGVLREAFNFGVMRAFQFINERSV